MIRYRRRSTDREQIALVAVWTAFALLFTVALAGTYRHPAGLAIFALCSTVAWLAVVQGIIGFCRPYDVVFEITTTELRFGREDRPEKRIIIRREAVQGIRIDFNDREIYCDMGVRRLRPCVPGGFLTEEQLIEVKQFLLKNWSSVMLDG